MKRWKESRWMHVVFDLTVVGYALYGLYVVVQFVLACVCH